MKNFIKPLAIATILLGSAGAAFAVCHHSPKIQESVIPATDGQTQRSIVVTAAEAYIYEEPNASSAICTTLKNGDKVTCLKIETDFFYVKFINKEGEVIKGYVYPTDLTANGQRPQIEISENAPECKTGKKECATDQQECTANQQEDTATPNHTNGTPATFPCPMKSITVGKKTFKVADLNDVSKVYKDNVNKTNCFFVVSKQEFRLYVYEVEAGDTALVAHYPVCYAKYPEGKTRQGDMRTPDCNMKAPFRISQICNASSWMHNFGDGRGNIPAYGSWFIRLDLSKSNVPAAIKSNRSIGIHGSSANKESVPGMDSEGCIRLRDTDIRDLKTRFAQVGTKVVVLPYNQGKLPFMKKAEKKLGTAYQYATKGYKTY